MKKEKKKKGKGILCKKTKWNFPFFRLYVCHVYNILF